MADDEDDDLYDDEFDFVDDLDEDDDEPTQSKADDDEDQVDRVEETAERRDDEATDPDSEAEEDRYAPPAPAANYVVHIYEFRQFKRTIDRPFTGEDAEAFASEYNRTAKPYGRFAVAGKSDAKPHKNLDDR